jgi:chemotaxis protein MotB
LLGLANESLDAQVAQLVDEREDVLEERDALEARLARVEDNEIELAKSLQQTTQELSVKAAALRAEAEKFDDLQGTYDGLVGDLESELAAGQIRIEQLRDGLELDVSQDILFASGSARLSKVGVEVLKTVASRLAPLDYEIAVEGHTDAVGIRGELKRRYPTNWDLAGARAASVVVLFVGSGIAGERLAAVSYGPYRPATDDDSPEGRALNRRIEIRLRPVESSHSPAAASGDAGS